MKSADHGLNRHGVAKARGDAASNLRAEATPEVFDAVFTGAGAQAAERLGGHQEP